MTSLKSTKPEGVFLQVNIAAATNSKGTLKLPACLTGLHISFENMFISAFACCV